MKSYHYLLLLVGVALVIWFYKRQSASASGSGQAFTGTAADPAVAELESSLAAVQKELERQTEKTSSTTP